MCKGRILEVSLLGVYLVLLSGKRSPEEVWLQGFGLSGGDGLCVGGWGLLRWRRREPGDGAETEIGASFHQVFAAPLWSQGVLLPQTPLQWPARPPLNLHGFTSVSNSARPKTETWDSS